MPSATFARLIEVAAPADECWDTLTDLPRLIGWVSIVDDAHEIERLSRYTGVLADRLGPFRLRADLAIQLLDVREGRHVHVVAEGEDRQVSSRIKLDATLDLVARDGGTRIVVEGSYEVTGRIATTGTSMIKKKADRILNEFFANAEKELG